MSQEVCVALEEKSQREVEEMCMKQMKEVIDAMSEANRVITERYVDKSAVMCGYNDGEGRSETIEDLDIELRKLYVVSHRAQQLECMMRYSIERKETKPVEKTTCVSPWFFIVGAMLIVCRKKM